MKDGLLQSAGPVDRRRFHSLVKAVDAGDPNARTGAYRTVVVEKWVLTAVLAETDL